MESSKWLIWSIEHDGWWKPNRHGYTKYKFQAGRYSFKDACEIVKNSNWRDKDNPEEAMVMDTET